MPLPRWSEAQAREAQRLVTTTTLGLEAISRRTGVPRRTLRDRAKRSGWMRPGAAPPAPSPAPGGEVLPARSAAERRLDILARALALAERHIAEAEELRAAPTADIQAREREARFIGTVITLVQRHQQAEAAIGASAGAGADARLDDRPGSAAEGESSSDDAGAPVPRSLDAVYRDFSRRLEALLGGRSGEALSAALDRAGALTGRMAPGGP